MVEQKDKIQLTVHSGVHTIGGTIVSIVYKNERVIFDFGTEFKPTKEVNEMLETINDDNALEIYLKAELIPNIEGVYKKNDMKTTVFVSHLHLDHYGGIGLIDPEIDVYMSEKSLKLYESIVKAGDKTYGHRTSFKSFEGTMQIGEFKVTIIPIDHDCYGSCGYIFEVNGKKIAFSGDVRFHGDAQKTLNFIEKAKNPDILLVEGVTNSFKPDDYEIIPSMDVLTTEQDIPKQFVEVIENNKDKVIAFDYYRTNIDRITNVIKAVEESGREVVFSKFHADIIQNLFNTEYKTIEEVKDFSDKSILLNLAYKEFDKYLDKLPSGSIYIHSNSEPLGDFDSKWPDFIEKLESRNIELVQIECTGHGSTENIQYFINSVNPKVLMPVHSNKPHLSQAPNNRIIPVVGETYIIEDITK